MSEKYFDSFLYGGDYNPEQWPEEVWYEDIEIFKDASINTATVNVFAWAKLQISENEYDFKELDAIVDLLSKENFKILMATSTAAMPAWMFKRYPEIARVDFYGRKHKFGHRHNACPNSLVYQKYATLLVEKIAERYSNNPNIVAWHINNEYAGECFCENCTKAFRVWLREKYKTLDALNKAWNTDFWSHTIYHWDEIEIPNVLTEQRKDFYRTDFAGISLDQRRFNSDSILNNLVMEREAIRKFDEKTPVFNNFKGLYKNFDLFKWAKEIDIVAYDSYPRYDTPMSLVAMTHDLMRGLKNKPFLLTEQTPSQQNWQPYNSLKKPGQLRALSYQTVAHGADSVLYFQMRRCIGGCEKFHGAVIEHSGTSNTRVFKEVATIGQELTGLDEILGTDNLGEVGIIFDWENFWALEYTSGPNIDLKYISQIHQYYEYFYNKNIPVHMISPESDFSKYKVVVAPVLYMLKGHVADALNTYIETGGTLVTTFMSGIVDQSDNVHLGGYPGPLRQSAGVWVEEIDALAPEQYNTVTFKDGSTAVCYLCCDLMHTEGAEVIAEYNSDFYKGTPVVTRNKYGNGLVYYVGTQLEEIGLAKILDLVVEERAIKPVIEEGTNLEITVRYNEMNQYYFVMNFSGETQPLPKQFANQIDLLTNTVIPEEQVIESYGTYIFKV